VSSPEALELVRTTPAYPEYELYPGAADGLRTLVDAGIEVHIIAARWNGDPGARTKTEEWLASRGLALGTHYTRIDAVKEGGSSPSMWRSTASSTTSSWSCSGWLSAGRTCDC
jgi:hypothetical protein